MTDYRYVRTSNILNNSLPLMLGLGGINSWDIEAIPPEADPKSKTIHDLFIYFPITTRKGATKRYSSNAVVLNGDYYDLTTVHPFQYAANINFKQIYLEYDLDHNLLIQNTFRTIGVYSHIRFNKGIDRTNKFFLPGDLSGNLIYSKHLKPIVKQPNMIQKIQLILTL